MDIILREVDLDAWTELAAHFIGSSCAYIFCSCFIPSFTLFSSLYPAAISPTTASCGVCTLTPSCPPSLRWYRHSCSVLPTPSSRRYGGSAHSWQTSMLLWLFWSQNRYMGTEYVAEFRTESQAQTVITHLFLKLNETSTFHWVWTREQFLGGFMFWVCHYWVLALA